MEQIIGNKCPRCNNPLYIVFIDVDMRGVSSWKYFVSETEYRKKESITACKNCTFAFRNKGEE